jgi:hypothetical protein
MFARLCKKVVAMRTVMRAVLALGSISALALAMSVPVRAQNYYHHHEIMTREITMDHAITMSREITMAPASTKGREITMGAEIAI